MNPIRLFLFSALMLWGCSPAFAQPVAYSQAYEQAKSTNALVVLISGESCPHCVVQEHFLAEKNVPFFKTRDTTPFGEVPKERPITLLFWKEEGVWFRRLFKGTSEHKTLIESIEHAKRRAVY